MSEPAVAASRAESTAANLLSSFTLGPRVIDARRRLGAVVLVSITGMHESRFAGVTGFAYCMHIGEKDASFVEKAGALLSRIQSLAHPSLVPVLEAGISEKFAYVAEVAISGERLSDRLTREPRLPAWQVVHFVENIGSALQAAHQQRIAHGMLSPLTIWIDHTNQARLGGFGLAGRGPHRDQELLASLSFELLSGRPWDGASAAKATGDALVDRIRGEVDGLSERVAKVIACGLEHDPAQRFPSVEAFASALRESVTLSSQEIAAGAWEAISRDDPAMAAILTKMLASYDPASSELALLTLRLSGKSIIDPVTPSTITTRQIPIPTNSNQELDRPVRSATGAIFSEAELRELFGGSQTVASTTRGNPWVIFLAVVFGMVAIMTVLAALMFNRT